MMKTGKKYCCRESMVAHFVLITIIYLIVFSLIPKKGFWCHDNGNKFIQTQAILHNNFASAQIPWPGRELTSDFTLNPIAPPFSIVVDQKMYSIYPPFFALVSAFLYSIFGIYGIYLLPLISGLLTILAVGSIVKLLKMEKTHAIYAMWCCAFATPILFYSFTFWEHTLITALCLWGIYWVITALHTQKEKTIFYFVSLFTLAIYFRDVIVFFAAITFLVYLFLSREKVLPTGGKILLFFSLSLAPLFIINQILIHNPVGFHISKHIDKTGDFLTHLADRAVVFYNLFIASHSETMVSQIIFFGAMALIVVLLIVKDSHSHGVLISFLIFIIGTCLAIIHGHVAYEHNIIYSNSLFAASPVLYLAFIRTHHGNRAIYLLFYLSLLYGLAYFLAAPLYGSGGFHWGCRFVLVLYPIMVILVMHAFKERIARHKNSRPLKYLFLTAILLCIGLQGLSLSKQYRVKSFMEDMNTYLQQQPDKIVLANSMEFTHMLPFSFFEKKFFNVTSERQERALGELIQTLRIKKIQSFLFLANRMSFARVKPLRIFECKDLRNFYCKFIRMVP